MQKEGGKRKHTNCKSKYNRICTNFLYPIIISICHWLTPLFSRFMEDISSVEKVLLWMESMKANFSYSAMIIRNTATVGPSCLACLLLCVCANARKTRKFIWKHRKSVAVMNRLCVLMVKLKISNHIQSHIETAVDEIMHNTDANRFFVVKCLKKARN